MNSIMGGELCIAELEVPGKKSLVVATSHLESPCPAPPKWDQMFSKERVDQVKEDRNDMNSLQSMYWTLWIEMI
jgi:tyrosyl-DNA phosphodiesterase 2